MAHIGIEVSLWGENNLSGWLPKNFKMPNCYPTEGTICLDDCMVSCPLWEECLHYTEESKDYDEELGDEFYE